MTAGVATTINDWTPTKEKEIYYNETLRLWKCRLGWTTDATKAVYLDDQQIGRK